MERLQAFLEHRSKMQLLSPSQNLQPWDGLQPLETAANLACPAVALWQLLVPLSLWGCGGGMSQGTLQYLAESDGEILKAGILSQSPGGSREGRSPAGYKTGKHP